MGGPATFREQRRGELGSTRSPQPLPKLALYQELLSGYLKADAIKPLTEQRTAIVLFEELQSQGFEGGYDSVRRYVQKWRNREEGRKVTAYIPQSFAPGEAFQFDWSYEQMSFFQPINVRCECPESEILGSAR